VEICRTHRYCAGSCKNKLNGILCAGNSAHSDDRDIDCLCNLTDNTVVNALQTVLDKANGAKIPVFGSEIEQVKSGCVASMGIDYYQLGIETGKMAAKILKGEEKASDTPFITASKAELYVNTAAADKIGMTLDADYIKDAAETFDKIEVK
jgi:putative ABC transport system substrate-binding protein